MTKLKVLCTIMLLALAPVVSGQVEYESVRVAVAPGVDVSEWPGRLRRNQSPSRLSTPFGLRQSSAVAASVSRRASSTAVWPSAAANKSAAVASGVLVIQAGSTVGGQLLRLASMTTGDPL